MKRLSLFLIVFVLTTPALHAADARRPMQLEDMFRFKRVSDPQISPDGRHVVYVVGTVDLEANKITQALWLASTDGKGESRQLTNPGHGKKDRHPRWSPDGQRILFESSRGGDYQLWLIELAGGEARKLTDIASEANTAIWSRDGNTIAFVSAVYPEYSEKPYAESNALNQKRKDEAEKSPVKVRTFTRLFFRHWDEYVEDKRQHLFVMSFVDGKAGEPKDVTPGDRDAYPTSDTFSVGDDFTFSPDGKYLLFTAPPERDEAWSTNYDICRVSVTGGTKEWECLTKENKGADSAPQFSPDGKWLAYRAQKKPGYEADKWDLVAYESAPDGTIKGKQRLMTGFVDYSVDGFAWVPGTQTIIYTVENRGRTSVFYAEPTKEAGPKVLFGAGGSLSSISIAEKGKLMTFIHAQMNRPPEVWYHRIGEGSIQPVTEPNRALLAQLDLPGPESVTVPGAGGTPMHMWILKPPGFDAKKKWPLAFLVHGGPQGAWEDGWSYRWNASLWAAQGYVVALPNPRGSTGFGQKYVDEISGDWGGKCYEDLMAGLAYMEKQQYIDPERMAAAGASFGGYMMNWFQGHTTKFKTLITHCSVYNFESAYATTDELWFDEWEHGGPPWKDRNSYEKFSPHRYAANFKTPMLVIHNDLDFRCPIGEGLQLFTTLQRLRIPSRMINFPDEGHWVLKPANSAHWHREVFAWLKKYAPPGGR
jgi:dipeptidyl aminopeptidase/acylaminoacyl peptidase